MQTKSKYMPPLQVADAAEAPDFGSLEALKRQFNRNFRLFLARRGLADDNDEGSFDGTMRRGYQIRGKSSVRKKLARSRRKRIPK